MPKYLVQGSYTAEGAKGLLKDGGSKRRAAVEEMAKSFGGKVEAFYYAFGDSEVFVIVDDPDNITAAVASLAVISISVAVSGQRFTVAGNRAGQKPSSIHTLLLEAVPRMAR